LFGSPDFRVDRSPGLTSPAPTRHSIERRIDINVILGKAKDPLLAASGSPLRNEDLASCRIAAPIRYEGDDAGPVMRIVVFAGPRGSASNGRMPAVRCPDA